MDNLNNNKHSKNDNSNDQKDLFSLALKGLAIACIVVPIVIVATMGTIAINVINDITTATTNVVNDITTATTNIVNDITTSYTVVAKEETKVLENTVSSNYTFPSWTDPYNHCLTIVYDNSKNSEDKLSSTEIEKICGKVLNQSKKTRK